MTQTTQGLSRPALILIRDIAQDFYNWGRPHKMNLRQAAMNSQGSALRHAGARTYEEVMTTLELAYGAKRDEYPNIIGGCRDEISLFLFRHITENLPHVA